MLLNLNIISENITFRLGRCRRMEDVRIFGVFDPSQIKCSDEALKESIDLDERAKEQHLKELEFFDKDVFLIGYVNIRSMKLHIQDVMDDDELMKCEIIGLGETWLSESIDVSPYFGNFVNGGRGKGVASLTRDAKDALKYNGIGYSILQLNIDKLTIIFVYLSDSACATEYIKDFTVMIGLSKQPTIIIGDVNFDSSSDNHPFKEFMTSRDFTQLVNKPTHLGGNKIDHVYANKQMEEMGLQIHHQPCYFSDHDKMFVAIHSM